MITTSHTSTFQIVLGVDQDRKHVACVIVKRSYDIKPGMPLVRRESDHPLRLIDKYYDDGDPEWATVEHEYELAPYKPQTDVVVIGKAYAPEGRPVPQMTAVVKVGARQKSILIIGDRECHFRAKQLPVFSDPVPFAEMEIRYERAYGGKDEISLPEIPFYYPRNTLGRGVVVRNMKASVEGLALPNIEDPSDRLTPERLVIEEPNRWHRQPLPQGFGWRQRSWYPRCALLGAYPAFTDVGVTTAEEQMGLLPKNHIALAKQSKLPTYLAEFNNGASIGLSFPRIKENEDIQLDGLTSNGRLTFSLPAETPAISLDIGEGEKALDAQLHTISIRPDDLEVDLIWRGAYSYEGLDWWIKSKRLRAEVI